MRHRRLTVAVLLASLSGSACAGRGPTPPGPVVSSELVPGMGPLALRVVYPPPLHDTTAGTGAVVRLPSDSTFVIQARDSTFLLGSAGRGDARLWINGASVPVHATGGWLAWLPLPDDSLVAFELLAVAGQDTARMTFVAPITPRYRAPPATAWIDTTSMTPRGDVWIRDGEFVQLRVMAAPDADVRGLLPDGAEVRFVPEAREADAPWGALAFDREVGKATGGVLVGSYTARISGPLGPDPGPVMAPREVPAADDSLWMRLQVVGSGDTAWTRWPLRLTVLEAEPPTVVVADDDTAGTGLTDSVLPGRPVPSGTYHWFFPTGTRAVVSGRLNQQVRLQLSGAHAAWADADGLHALPAGTAPPSAVVRSLRAVWSDASVVLRIPVSAPVPFLVSEETHAVTVRFYGAVVDADWIQYGGTDPFVRVIRFDQAEQDVVTVTVELSEAVWGYRTRWVSGALELEIRRPPAVNLRHPLAGRVIAVDAGHPPGGARGPTGAREADVVLAVARETRRLLVAAGATVVLTRLGDEPLGLWERVQAAERAGAEILVSVHANALPDGVNPFVNNGTSVYYFHPRSAPLARALDRALVAHLGVRDLGFGRGDLALVRGTWMPSALTEGLFMMVPDQEAMLLSEDGQRRYARGIVEGLEAFLLERARAR